MKEENILVCGARERNLKNFTVSIPKNKITTVVGLSGSGKSALVFNTIAAESQRQLNETYSSFIRNRLPHYGKPNVDSISNLPVSIVINQKRLGDNPRSTVGTITDVYSLLRLLFSRIGDPFIGYSDSFSFNNSKGMCQNCEGLGVTKTVNIEKLLDLNKSLNEGAILFPTFYPNGFRWKRYVDSGLFDNNKKLKDYTNDEMDTLLYKSGFKPKNPTKDFPPTSLYEGVIPRIKRSFLFSDSSGAKTYQNEISNIISNDICPVCLGTRLNKIALSSKINSKNIGDCVQMPITKLLSFINKIHISKVQSITDELKKQLSYMQDIGLGYLTLSRGTTTLSGGESQRIKMIKQLGSSLNGLAYIFDEPSVGLHPYNIYRINKLLQSLKDKGNTILIVDHDNDVIKISDFIIELGKYSGNEGGSLIFEGNLNDFKGSASLTSNYLYSKHSLKKDFRNPNGWINLKNVSLNNIKNLTVSLPKGILTVITGVAGSGKSTLIGKILPSYYPECVVINQKSISTNKRSNIATYTKVFDNIRELFAKENNVSLNLFSSNSKGACPNCKGLGSVELDLAFMDNVSETCEMCKGKKYSDKALSYLYKDKNIDEILNLNINEAYEFFIGEKFSHTLKNLIKVGLEYIKLGQPLSTLSGGELQRLKIANKLDVKNQIYIFDEPTTGLHPYNVTKLLSVFDNLIENGCSLYVIEHNMDIMCNADWIIDIGVGAGEDGGNVLFSGKPNEILNNKKSITGKFLKEYLI